MIDEHRIILNEEWNLFHVTSEDNKMLAMVSIYIWKAVFMTCNMKIPDKMEMWGMFPALDWGDSDAVSKTNVLTYLLQGYESYLSKLKSSTHLRALSTNVDVLVVFLKEIIDELGVKVRYYLI